MSKRILAGMVGLMSLSAAGCGLWGTGTTQPTTPSVVGTWTGQSQVSLAINGVASTRTSNIILVIPSQTGNVFNGTLTWTAVTNTGQPPLTGTNAVVGVITNNNNFFMADEGTGGAGAYEGVLSGNVLQFVQTQPGEPAIATLTTLTKQ